jgi:hypothetical protein
MESSFWLPGVMAVLTDIGFEIVSKVLYGT